MLIVIDEKTGTEVKSGETVTDFRGDKATLLYATRARSVCESGGRSAYKSGLVCVKWQEKNFSCEYYDKVFDLKVVETVGKQKLKYNERKERIFDYIQRCTLRLTFGCCVKGVDYLSYIADCSKSTTRKILKELADEKRIEVGSAVDVFGRIVTAYKSL